MEIPMLTGMQAQMGLPYVQVADLSLRELFALCESAHSMVSVDTGPAHAAAALGVPLVVLYGVESPAYWLPRGGFGKPVIGLGGPPESRRVDQISLETVLGAWRSLERR
jgi:ADP-heptose:LPS heptosyltransferase